MSVPEVCVEEILKEEGSLWEGDEPFEIFWSAAENLYDTALRNDECFNALKLADRVTFQELRAAFRPDRDPVDVMWAGDKVWRLAKKIITNSRLYMYSTEPTCCDMNLEDVEEGCEEVCYFYHCSERDLKYEGYDEEEIDRLLNECELICDCPDGYKDFNPLEYAYENIVFRTRDGDVLMYYSDFPQQLASCVKWYERAREEKDVSEMVLALDCMINALHGYGSPLADFLVEGGVRTLDTLKEIQY